MIVNFEQSLARVLKHEGGFVNHPSDPGGATNKGITLATFRRYVKRNGTVNDLKRITGAQVAKVYQKHYWNMVGGDDLPPGTDYAVFDFAANSGPRRAIKFLQRVVGAKIDGAFGPGTLAATRNFQGSVSDPLCKARLAWLKTLKSFPIFGRGWSRRVNDVKRVAARMSKQGGEISRPKAGANLDGTPNLQKPPDPEVIRKEINRQITSRPPSRRSFHERKYKMEFLAGYKTYIVGALMVLVAGAAMFGITVPGFDDIDAGQMIMEAFALIFLRKGIASTA